MKKFLVPMMLGILTVGALTSCNNSPTNKVNADTNIVHVKRAEQSKPTFRVVDEVNEVTLQNAKITTAKALGLNAPTASIPNYSRDFSGKTTFDYLGFSYSASTDSSTNEVTVTRTGAASNAGTIETLYAGKIVGTTLTTSSNELTSFTSAKSIVGSAITLGTNTKSMINLETIVCGDTVKFDGYLKESIKFIVFSSDITSFEGLKYVNAKTKLVCPQSIAVSIRKQIDKAYRSDSASMVSNPILYVVPDEDVTYSEGRSEVYEVGGGYVTPYQNKYALSYMAPYVKKAAVDLTVLEDVSGFTTVNHIDSDNTYLEELYYKEPEGSLGYFKMYSADKLYLGNIDSEFWGTYYRTFREVYLPDGYGFTNVKTNLSGLENTTFYIPDTNQESGDYDYIIGQFDTNNISYKFYDASEYTPTMEVEVDGVRKSTKDMTVSYEDLVMEAYNEAHPNQGSNDNEEKNEQDKEAAAPVQDSISNLDDEITLESKDSIIEAKEAFEALTYDQQQLVENANDLKKAIEEYNKLVVEYNKDIEDEEQHLDLIEELHVKNRVEGFIEDIKDDKVMTAVTVLVGTVFGGFLIYGLYKLISKFARWVRR